MLLPGHVGDFRTRKGKGVVVNLQGVERTAIHREGSKDIFEKAHG
jgi:hypothetical protein